MLLKTLVSISCSSTDTFWEFIKIYKIYEINTYKIKKK